MSSIDENEVRKFSKSSKIWWENYNGLIALNEVRVPLIKNGIITSNLDSTNEQFPLEGCKIIDVGCGGGILSESLARLGATVTGLDPSEELINAAIDHSSRDEDIQGRLTYICDTVENLSASSPGAYDVVVCSEVVEHVENVPSFVKCCVDLGKEGGHVFFTTINRTFISYLVAIVGAEYLFKIIPRGTHDWNKFVTPDELQSILGALNCTVVSKKGYVYSPLTWKFHYTDRLDTFYFLHARK